MQLCQMQLSATLLNAIPLKKDEKIVYKNNAILLSKVWRKYKKHYSTDFKSHKRWNNRPPTLKSVKLYRKMGHFSLRIHDIIGHFSLKNWTI